MIEHSLNRKSHILKRLAEGAFISGEALATELNLSRTAIANHIKDLEKLGLDIYSVRGKGYKLARPISLLNQDVIVSLKQINHAPLTVLQVVDSTNIYLKQQSENLVNGQACIAEAQTAGRGRHGRTWVSPFAASLYFSMAWSFAGGYQSIGGLSLAVGVAVARVLEKLGIPDVQLKWPNDIYAQNKKLAGVLIEAQGQVGGSCECIIGIGINVALPSTVEGIDQAWIDLAQLSTNNINRNELCALLSDELCTSLSIFEQQGLHPFVNDWRNLDVFKQKTICLLIGQQKIEGIGQGIDSTGALLLETGEGIRAYHGGEISVRAR